MYTPYDVVTWRNEPSRCSKKTPNNSSALLAAALQPMRCACTTPSQQQTNTHLYRFLNLIRSTPNTLNARKLTISMLLSDYFAFEDVPNNLIVIISFFFSERCADQWLRQKGTVSDRHTKVIQAGASYTLSDRNKSPTIITLFISTKRRHQFPWHRRPPSRVPFVIIRGFFMRRAIFGLGFHETLTSFTVKSIACSSIIPHSLRGNDGCCCRQTS